MFTDLKVFTQALSYSEYMFFNYLYGNLRFVYFLFNYPFLEEGFALMMIHETVPKTSPLEIQLSSAIYLYSVSVGKLQLPSCSIPGVDYQRRSGGPEELILYPVDSDLAYLRRNDLKQFECLSDPDTCPICQEMDDEDLEDLICSSEKGKVKV